MLPVFVTTFFLRSKGFLMSWLQPPCTVTLEPRKQDLSRFCFLLFYLPCSDGPGYYGFHFFINIDFVLSSFNLLKRLFSSSLLSAIRVVASAYMILFHTEMIPAVGPITITWVWFLPYDFHLQQFNKMSKLVRQNGQRLWADKLKRGTTNA